MASFASTPVEFTPYIPPSNLELEAQNIELEGKVAMHLQQQYNQNAQKIQGVVDTIAGLDVAKNEDKQYLNKAVGQLMTDLKTIAGSDLSKQSIVNQAASFASKIYNDVNVQNAVTSTKNYRDAITQIQEANKAGKGAASNNNYVLREVNKWLSDGQAGTTLGAQTYIPYYDYQDPFLDFLKAKQVSVEVYQDPAFGTTNPDGSINAMTAYAMVEGKKEILTPQEVSNLFQQFLATNAQAQTQVDIDATYFSDLTPTEAALSQVQSMREQTLAQMTAELEDLEIQQAAQADTDEGLDRKIELYKQNISSIRDSAAEQDRMFLSNPEAAKKGLFTTNLVNSMGSSFAYQKMEKKYTSNPIRSAYMDEQRFILEQNTKAEEINLKKQRLELDRIKALSGSRRGTPGSDGGTPQAGLLTAGGVDTDVEDRPTVAEADIYIDSVVNESLQEKLKTVYEMTRGTDKESWVTLGRDSSGRATYSWNRNTDFLEVWDKMTTGEKAINKNLNTKAPSIRAYFNNPTDITRGIGKELYAKTLVEKRAAVREQIKREYSTIPEFAERWDEQIRLSDGSTVTFGDLVSRINAEDVERTDFFDPHTIYDSDSFRDIRERTPGVNVAARVNLDMQSGSQQLLGDLLPGVVGKRLAREATEQALYNQEPELFQALAVIARNKKSLRNKSSAAQDLYNQTINQVAQNKHISLSFKGEDQKYARDIGAALLSVVPTDKKGKDLLDLRKDLTAALGDSNASITATTNGISGEYTFTVFSSKDPVVIKVDPLTAGSLLPELLEQKSGIRKMLELKAEEPGEYAELDFMPVINPNTNKIRFQYKVAGSESSGYTATVRYQYLDGPWKQKTGPIFATPEEAEGAALNSIRQNESTLFSAFEIQP